MSPEQAKDLKNQLEKKYGYELLNNPQRINEEFSPSEVVCFTSATSEDGKGFYYCLNLLNLFCLIGKFFENWISCLIVPGSLQKSKISYPRSKVHANSITYKCVQPNLRKFCSKKKIKSIHLLHHHIALRAISSKPLPALSTTSSECSKRKLTFYILILFFPLTASHLCDTTGCIREEHLELEHFTTNYNRLSCPGVILIVKSKGPSAPKHITQVEPATTVLIILRQMMIS